MQRQIPNPTDASRDADAALAALPQAGRRTPDTRAAQLDATTALLRQQSQNADQALGSLRRDASALQRRLPTVESAELQRQDMERRLQGSGVEGIRIGGEVRYVDEAAHIRRLGQQGVETMRGGRLEEGRAMLAEAEAKLGGLAEIISRQRRLVAAGASAEVVNAAEGVFHDYGTDTQRRAEQHGRAIDLYVQNADIMNYRQMHDARANLEGVITVLGQAAAEHRTYDDQAYNRTVQVIDTIGQSIATIKAEILDTFKDVSLRWSQDIAAMRAHGSLNEQYRAQLDDLHGKAEDIHRRLEAGQQVSQEELESFSRRVDYAQRASAALERIDNPVLVTAVSAIYARGLDAAKAGKNDEAEIQSFIATDYTRQGVTSTQRTQLERWSTGLAGGTLDAAAVRREIGTAIAADLERASVARIVPNESIRTAVGGIETTLRGSNVSMEDLARGQVARQYLANYARDRDRIPARDREARETLGTIYARGFNAINRGLPASDVQALFDLGQMYASPDARGNEAIAAKRAEIERMSQRVEQTALLRAMHGLVTGASTATAPGQPGPQMTPQQAAQRLLGQGAEADALVASYQGLGTNEQTRSQALVRMEGEAQMYIQVSRTHATLVQRRQEAARRSSDSTEALMFDTPLQAMEGLLGAISRGEHPTDDQIRRVQAYTVLHTGTADEVAQFFATSPEDVPRMRAMFAGTGNVSETLSGLSGRPRDMCATLFVMMSDAIENGHFDQVAVHYLGANAYSKARTDNDRYDVFQASFLVSSSDETVQGHMTPDAAIWMHRMQLDRSNSLNGVTDQRLVRNINAYYDMALVAYQQGDTSGADSIRMMANLYGSAIKQDQSNPVVQQSLTTVYRLLGDHRTETQLNTHRIRDISRPEGELARWQPAPDALSGIIFHAIVSRRSVADELGQAQAATSDQGTAFGDVLAVPANRRLEGLTFKIGLLESEMGRVEHAQRRNQILGTTAQERANNRGHYNTQLTFTRARARLAETRGDQTEADRQNAEASRIDLNIMGARLDRSDQLYDQGITLIRQSEEMKRTALTQSGPQADATNRQADQLAQRGIALIQMAESAQTALGGLNRSITSVYTINRERGRLQFDRAANTFLATGEEMQQSGSAQPNSNQQGRLQLAGSDMQTGNNEVARQRAIQQMVAQTIRTINQLQTQVNENERLYGDGRQGGALTTSRELQGIAGSTLPAGSRVVATSVRREELNKARRAANGEQFGSANVYIGRASRGIQVDRFMAQTESTYRFLIAGGTAEEQRTGFFSTYTQANSRGEQVTVGFDYQGIMGTLFTANNDIAGNRFNSVDRSLSGLPNRITLGMQTQMMLNDKHRLEGNITDIRTMTADARSWGLLTSDQQAAQQRQDNEDRAAGRKPDLTGRAAHQEVINFIRNNGGLENLAANGDRLAGTMTAHVGSIDNVLNNLVENGPLTNVPGSRNMPAILNGIFHSRQWDPRYYENIAIRDGYEASFNELIQHAPNTLIGDYDNNGVRVRDGALQFMVRNGEITQGEADFLTAQVRSGQLTQRFQNYASGHQLAMGSYRSAMQMFDGVDQYEREHGYGGNGAWYINFRGHAGQMLQIGMAASSDPEGVTRSILRGDAIQLPNLRGQLRRNNDHYDDAYIDIPGNRTTYAGALYSSVHGYFDAVQSFSVGNAVSARENFDRMDQGLPPILTHTESVSLAQTYTDFTLARMGIVRVPVDREVPANEREYHYVQVPLGSDEHRAILQIINGRVEGTGDNAHMVGGLDNVMGQYIATGLQLTRIYSEGERNEMYQTLGAHLDNMDIVVRQMLTRRYNGEAPATTTEIERYNSRIERSRSTMQTAYDASLRSGRRSESIGRGFEAVGKLVGAGVMIATGFGSAAGVAMGVDALHSLSTDSRRAGGFSQLSTEQQVLGIGAVALSFAGAGFGEFTAIANESMQVARMSTMALNEAAAAGDITANLATEASALARPGMLATQFAMGGRIATYGGYTLMATGMGMAGWGAYRAGQAWMAGEMTGFEFFTTGVLGVMQAGVPVVGSHLMPTRFSSAWTSESFGARVFRGGMLFLTGETAGSVEAANHSGMAIQHYREFTALPTEQLSAYRSVEAQMGRALTPEEGIRVMRMMPADRLANGNVRMVDGVPAYNPMDAATAQRFAAEARLTVAAIPRMEALAQAHADFVAGRLTTERATELGLRPGDVALFNQGGPLHGLSGDAAQQRIGEYAVNETRLNLFDQASGRALEQAVPAGRQRTQNMLEGYRLFLDGKLDEAAVVRLGLRDTDARLFNRLSRGSPEEAATGIVNQANGEVAQAVRVGDMRSRAEAARAQRRTGEFEQQLGHELTSGQETLRTLNNVKYTQDHVQASAEIASAAERIIRGTPVEDLGLTEGRALAARALAGNPEFQRAIASSDNATVMRLALDRTTDIPDIRVTQDAVNARVGREIEPALADRTIPPNELRTRADQSATLAEQQRAASQDSHDRAQHYPAGSPERASFETLARRQEMMAAAYEGNATRLRTEAGNRETTARQEIGAQLESAVANEIQNPPGRGITQQDVLARARDLAEAYRLGGNITEADIARLHLSEGDVRFVRQLGSQSTENIPAEIARYSADKVYGESPRARFEPARFRQTLVDEEASLIADADRIHATPDDIRHIANGRREYAQEWEARADEAMSRARLLEIEGASEELVSSAYAQAGRDTRIANEYRLSADRLDAEAARRSGEQPQVVVPQQERTPQALERDVGPIVSNPELEAAIVSFNQEQQRIARVLDAIIPGRTTLSAEQIAEWPAEYRGALQDLNNADPAIRTMHIHEWARRIAYDRAAVPFNQDMQGRLGRNEVTQNVVDNASALHKVLHGGNLLPAEFGRVFPEDNPGRLIDAVQRRIGEGMPENEAILAVAREMAAPAVTAPRTRAHDVVAQSAPARLFSADARTHEILRRAGYELVDGQLRRVGEPSWMVGGETIAGERVQTGDMIRSIEGVVTQMAQGGQEMDIVVISGDKTKLNQVNQLLGMQYGDQALSAYRGIFRRAVMRGAGEIEGAMPPFLIRPSASGDETIAIIVVPRGQGENVRGRIESSLTTVTDEVFTRLARSGRSGGLYDVFNMMRDPRTLITAAIDVGTPVSLVRGPDGEVHAVRLNGSAVRPDGQTRGFLSVQVRSAEEEGALTFAPGMRDRLGVQAQTEIRRASNVSDVGPGQTVGGVVFDLRLSVTDPAVLADMESHLPTTRKGLAEVETNMFGLRGLNTFLGHYGANAVVNAADEAVGAFAAQRGLTIRRLGTMKYVIEGGTATDYIALRRSVDDSLQSHGLRFRTAQDENVPPVIVPQGTAPDEALASIANGHLRLEWGSRKYDAASSLISTMAIGGDSTLTQLLGQGHGLDRVIDFVRRNPAIRNVEDLMIALRTPSLSGAEGPAMREAFVQFVDQRGAEFRQNLADLPRRTAQAAAPPVAVPLSTGAVVQQIGTETTRIRELYDRYQDARVAGRNSGNPEAWRTSGEFTLQQQQEIDAVNSTIRSRGLGRSEADFDVAISAVVDARLRPNAVQLGSEFTGMPAELQGRTVTVLDGTQTTLGRAPRARLLSRIDSDRATAGTTAGVFRSEMLINGQPQEVVVKVFTNPHPDSNHGLVNWDAVMAHATREYNNLKILADLGLGPRPLGFVNVDGNLAIAMERVQGEHLDRLTPTELRRVVTPETFRQLGAAVDRMHQAGYGNEDFQYAVLTRDQTINGVQRHAGDVVVWDAGGLQTIQELNAEALARGERYQPITSDQLVRGEQNHVDVRLIRDYIGGVSPESRTALEQFFQGALTPEDIRASGGNLEEMARRFIIRGREQRTAAGATFLQSMTDRLAATRLENTLRNVEQESGVQLLPAREGGPGPGGRRQRTGPTVVMEGGNQQAAVVEGGANAVPRGQAVAGTQVEQVAPVIDLQARRQANIAATQSAQVVNDLHLQVPEQLAAFARRIVRGDTEAAAQFAQLDRRVQDQVRVLTNENNTAFRSAALGNDNAFNNHVRTFGRRQISAAAGGIEAEVPRPQPNQQVRPRAVNEGPVDVVGQPLDNAQPQTPTPRQGNVVGIAPEGPRAMAGNENRGNNRGNQGNQPRGGNREGQQGGQQGGRQGGRRGGPAAAPPRGGGASGADYRYAYH